MVENTMNEVKMTNLELIDEESFFNRLSSEQRKLYSIAFSYLRNEADALEVVQEASCRAWMKRKKLKDEQSFTPWLIRITINCCMDELRRKKRVFPVEKLEDETAQEMKSSDRIDLERAMDRMKPKYRHVVMLKYYQDMKTVDIAKVLKKPEGTIKTWLREGLKQLRNYL
ncbi:sigma-70 family RNA polymerase sigma factor [Paenibacillus dokdonensis]|uniref:Sigma-70 family RNA polymerase sigma factor n=1 Tax=Paenibacillus dokdonensis TaxID=2567944 RepID=A0ABU6GT96_9BACL|nr:sigma-70 family RNA polymerase sigma factor [Paenibacillus dokdonensis]MEC0242638.1 sigma-70 family RNA polymerase sigma factor [Paenibacillus dokdonensis]